MKHHFFAYVSRLRYIRRWGLMRSVMPENDAEHSLQVAMIAHAIAELEGMEAVTEEEYQEQVDYWVDQYYGYMTEEDIIQNMGEIFLRESAFSAKMDKWLMDQVIFTYADGTPVVSITEDEA